MPQGAGGAEPGSIEADADPETRAKIKKGRKQADMDLAAIERWARGGFTSVVEETDG